jgi:nucleotide sugar dehydrogenase
VVDLFHDSSDVVVWDIAHEGEYPGEDLRSCKFAVICVGTPLGVDATPDLSSVEEAVHRVPCESILLKSTVPPRTTDRLIQESGKEICYWPEYVSESRYFNPFFPQHIREVPFVIIGGNATIRRRYIDLLMPVLGPTKSYYQCEALEAEIVKYMENCFFATKIMFVNEFRSICDAFGADWHTVREGWLQDPRIERMHTAAFDEDRGFGGKCLPKDLETIIWASTKVGYTPDLLTEVRASNARFRAGSGPKFHE